MSVRIGVLMENSDLSEGLENAFTSWASESSPPTTCDDAIAKLKKTKFTAQFTDAEDLNYRQAVQRALDAGLKKLTSYPETDTQQKWTDFWAEPDGANLAHLLSSKSTRVGCAIGTCVPQTQEYRTSQTSAKFLFCEMKPAAEENKAPFDKEYYEALTERKTPLTAMTEEDLKAPVQGAAAAAVPSLGS
ncbi:SAG family member [Eimeria mitis]|uniref:SAG family member n=1 Tax=Eimeria mitis TaxID=44415 RepID=U6JN52_9EIME|nr:SAG family member [Eimeria mitis]CDJ26934.1 SAG family member [Eimeria mitis]